MKNFIKMHFLIGAAIGTAFTILCSMLFEITELKTLLLMVVTISVATVISALCQVAKVLVEVFKEEILKKF